MKAADDVRQELKRMADLDKAKILQRFFKTGPVHLHRRYSASVKAGSQKIQSAPAW
jgi:hypothetical protein